jgi:hypothetical protein
MPAQAIGDNTVQKRMVSPDPLKQPKLSPPIKVK